VPNATARHKLWKTEKSALQIRVPACLPATHLAFGRRCEKYSSI
jgi:hypothetical protein